MREDRTEGKLHGAFWDTMQHAMRDAEQAIIDARPLIVKLRDLSDPDGGDYYLATAWLAEHGS